MGLHGKVDRLLVMRRRCLGIAFKIILNAQRTQKITLPGFVLVISGKAKTFVEGLNGLLIAFHIGQRLR